MKNIFRPVRLLFGGVVRRGRGLPTRRVVDDSLSGFLFVVLCLFTFTNPAQAGLQPA